MELSEFQALSRREIAHLVRQAGTRVCVFPVKGTRRWFMLENPTLRTGDLATAYLDAVTRRSIEIYQMMYEHGIDTILSPSFSPDVMARGEDYVQMIASGMANPVAHPAFMDFCQTCGVRVRFYGDYRAFFDGTALAGFADLYDGAAQQTEAYGNQHRLYIGMFAHDPAETIAKLAIRYHGEHGNAPNKNTLIRLYYGAHVDPVDLFIGFGKLRAFDMPLVATGREDLYFMVSPSLFLTEGQLREILYDHLYARTRTNANLSPEELRGAMRDSPGDKTQAARDAQTEDWAFIKGFYAANNERTLGVGASLRSGVWYPLPQVATPPRSRDNQPDRRSE